ncbi:unnamed protein product [Rotaria magnacalcarata]|uniref:Carboxylesterase type B domain-containing protein n=7 Tax=Rotaria magnacalcarata TaxID=392030 RepID=A0A816B8C6_9BILA|nr:unnamed protein product [Rotaria magnacalcarata]CAF1607138.1 unnamed protein product [Rotaria magnacalcarata]
MITSIIILLLLIIHESITSIHLLNTTSGIYVGQTAHYRDVIIQQYLGIKYGRIEKRFDHAEPIRKENDTIIDATSLGPVCKPTIDSCEVTTQGDFIETMCAVTYGIFSLISSANEECLFLNVYIPINNKTSQNKKAILMWIHGGSGQIGTGNIFDGTILAALGDIIVVTFNFRLNLFGFLSSGDERLLGNIGLYDQSMVLDWIYENSEALGGDIERITVGGHSAGAPHAYYLAISPFNQGRIRRLILQSGSPFNIWSHIQANQAMERFDVVADDNQCGMMDGFDEKLNCLRETNYHFIAEYEHHTYTSAYHTNVVLHGDYMNKFQLGLNSTDTLADTEMLIGSNDDEGVFVAIIPVLMEQQNQTSLELDKVNYTSVSLKFLAAMQPNKTCLHKKALELYHINPAPDDCSESPDCYCSLFYNYSRLISDVLFFNDYYRFLTQRIQSSKKTFAYEYSYRTSQDHQTLCNDYLYKRKLVGHFAELEYTWGTPLLFEKTNSTNKLIPLINYTPYDQNATDSYTNEQIAFSELMIEQWSNFIKNGQPNSKTKFENPWIPLVNISNGLIMHFNMNQNEMKKFEIPLSVQFWMNTCSTIETSKSIDLNDQASTDEISFTLFSFTSLFVLSILQSSYVMMI